MTTGSLLREFWDQSMPEDQKEGIRNVLSGGPKLARASVCKARLLEPAGSGEWKRGRLFLDQPVPNETPATLPELSAASMERMRLSNPAAPLARIQYLDRAGIRRVRSVLRERGALTWYDHFLEKEGPEGCGLEGQDRADEPGPVRHALGPARAPGRHGSPVHRHGSG